MTKPPRSKKANPARNVLNDLAALGQDMAMVAAAFVLKKPDAMGDAEFWLQKENDRAGRAAQASKLSDLTGSNAAAQKHHLARAAALSSVIAMYSRIAETWREDEGETPARRVYASRDKEPILALWEGGKITTRQERAARHLAWVYHSVVSSLMPRTGNMDAAGRAPGGSWRGLQIGWTAAHDHAHVYLPWTRELVGHNIPLEFIIDICIDGHSMRAARDRQQMGWQRSITALRKGLDLYADRVDSSAKKASEEFAVDPREPLILGPEQEINASH
jgi:hypothetical protein